MKRYVVAALVLLSVLVHAGWTSAADQTAAASTDYEAFAARKGVLLTKDFYQIGSMSGSYSASVKVVALASSTPEGIRVYAVRLEMPPRGKNDETQIGVLDFDELESMVQSLDYMIALSGQMQNEAYEYREVDFTTRAGVKVGFYQSGKAQSGYLYVNGYASNGHMFLAIPQLEELRILLQRAVEKLRSLGA